jgi:hypothetical protein
MPAATRARQAQDRVERQAGARRAGGEEQQRDLARRIESETEQEPDRVHVPGFGDRLGEAPEDPVHQSP